MLESVTAFPFQAVVSVLVLVPELHGDFVGEGCGEEFFAEAVGSWRGCELGGCSCSGSFGCLVGVRGRWDSHLLLTFPFLG